MEKMTKRMFLEGVAGGKVTEEIMEYAKMELEKLTESSKRRAEKAAEKMAEYEPMITEIIEKILGDEPMTSSQVGDALGVSFQKAGVPLKMAVERGLVTTVQIKEKSRAKKGYILAR